MSWNFKHIVNINTIKGIKVLTTMEGYKDILIYSPEAFQIDKEDNDENKIDFASQNLFCFTIIAHCTLLIKISYTSSTPIVISSSTSSSTRTVSSDVNIVTRFCVAARRMAAPSL